MTNKKATSFEVVKNNKLYRSVIDSIEGEDQKKLVENQVMTYVTALEKVLAEIQKKSKENK
tara:strand:- start:666 stop:848 length:183 start_codon:yes stop_codon:yes gene_type:complete